MCPDGNYYHTFCFHFGSSIENLITFWWKKNTVVFNSLMVENIVAFTVDMTILTIFLQAYP